MYTELRRLWPFSPTSLRHLTEHIRCKAATRCGLYLALFALLCPSLSYANPCLVLFKQGNLIGAANCFLRYANALKGKLSLTQRYTKGRYLKNAAQAFRAAAKRSGNPAQRTYLRERALLIYLQYLKEQLHENQRRLLWVLKQKSLLKKQVGYSLLLIRVAQPAGKICIRGHKYNKCRTAQEWRATLRPGRYLVEVQRPQSPAQRRKVLLRPRTRKLVAFAKQGTQTLIRALPKGSQVYIDGVMRGRAPLQVTLPPGSHKLRVTKGCYQTQERSFQVRLGAPEVVYVKLQALALANPHRGKRILGWTGVIAGIAIGGFGLIAQGVSAGHYATTQAYTNAPAGLTREQYAARFAAYKEATPQANTWQSIAIPTMAVGGVSLGLGIIRLLTIPKAEATTCPPS